ncbi:MAG: DUF4252 domain-containing protein [Flavobacteriaceae bacterium]
MKRALTLLAAIGLLLASCSSTQSLQEYYIDNSENPDFLSLDVPVSVLNLEEVELSEKQREALESFKKLNILAFKKTEANGVSYQAEKAKVKQILKNSDFEELMKMNTPMGKASVQFLGDDNAIDEVVIYGDSKERGFALIRVLGKDMSPAHFMEVLKAIEKSDYQGEGLEQLGEFLKG